MTIKLDKKVSNQERDLLDHAKDLSSNGNFEGSLIPLRKLVELDGSCAIYHGMLGNMLWELKRHKEAEVILKKAVDLSPESEAISTNLFHVLWEQDKNDLAFEEIKRFTKLTGSNSYDEIIKEINSS